MASHWRTWLTSEPDTKGSSSDFSFTAAVTASRRTARAPLVTLRDLLLLLYLYPLQFFFRPFSRERLYQFGRVLEPFLQFHFRNWRKTAAARMLATPGAGISADQAPLLARQLVSNAICRSLDDLIISRPKFLHEISLAEVSGLEHVEMAMRRGRGVLIVSGHFSAVRLARRYLATASYPMLAVRAFNPSSGSTGRLSGLLAQRRLAQFLRSAVRDEADPFAPDCTLKILQRLRSGGLVNMTLDAPGGARTAEGRLLGVPWRFSTGLLDIVRLSGCSVVPMLCLGNGSDLRIVFSPALDIAETSSRDEFICLNLPKLVHLMEQQIADHPADWVLWALL
jgi:lauroyl/myristoyl acyltransferase